MIGNNTLFWNVFPRSYWTLWWMEHLLHYHHLSSNYRHFSFGGNDCKLCLWRGWLRVYIILFKYIRISLFERFFSTFNLNLIFILCRRRKDLKLSGVHFETKCLLMMNAWWVMIIFSKDLCDDIVEDFHECWSRSFT